MNEGTPIVKSIIKGIQDKKGHDIRVVDLEGINDAICKYLVVCEGNSPSQVAAIYESVRETALKNDAQKPVAVDGLRNSLWVAMDYSDVVVHIFVSDVRTFYDIDHLWDDAEAWDVPNFE